MVLRRLAYGFTSFALSISSLFVLASPVAHAATVAWDGEGGDNNFSTAANWVGDVVPVNGDSITFNLSSGIVDGDELNNDLVGLQLAGLVITGDGGDIQGPNIVGNPFDLQGSITTSYTGAFFGVSVPITLSGNLTITGSNNLYFLAGSSIDLTGYDLSISNYGTFFEGPISGAGNIISGAGMGVSLGVANSTTANISVTGGYLSAGVAGSLGTGSVTINGADALVILCGFNGATVNNSFVLNGADTGVINATKGCSGGGQPTATNPLANVTLAGNVTLQKNSKIGSQGVLKVTGPLLGSYTLSLLDGQVGSLVVDSSDNQSLTPNGSSQSANKTTEVTDKLPATNVIVPVNETLVIKETGERGVITLSGGTLKGTGTVGIVNMGSGKVAPGLSPGILNTGNLVFAGGTLEIEIGGATAGSGDGFHDQTNVTGTVDLGANVTTLTTLLWNSFVPTLGQNYTIVNNDGSDAVVGTFVDMADDSSFTQNGVTYSINYNGGDGNDVVLTVTAVPAAAAATVPNTGFEQLKNNPVLTMVITIMAVVGISFAARRQLTDKK